MASSRTAGPRVGGLVPITVAVTATVNGSNLYILPLPACRYRVGRINVGSGAVANDTYTVSVGNNSSATVFLNAQVLAVGSSNIIDAASADTSEKTATSGTSYLLVTLTQNTTATVVNPTVTIWMWMSSTPVSLARRGDPGSLNQQGL